jgi:hypothetical protein
MKKQKILQVNFSHMKSYENVAQIPDKIYLLDNFDEKKDKISHETLDFPVQLQMPMTIICTAGEGEISINLQHYNIHAGQIASVTPNSLFQFIKASTGFECACIMVNKNVMPINFNVKLGIEAAMSLKDLPVFTPSLKDFSIIIDAYNANPTSMAAALENFKLMKADHKMCILGHMGELGEVSGEEHRKIVALLQEAGFEKVWLVGEEFVKTPCPGNFVLFNNVDEVKQVLAAEKPKGMTVLVKGSNSTRMFELPAYL